MDESSSIQYIPGNPIPMKEYVLVYFGTDSVSKVYFPYGIYQLLGPCISPEMLIALTKELVRGNHHFIMLVEDYTYLYSALSLYRQFKSECKGLIYLKPEDQSCIFWKKSRIPFELTTMPILEDQEEEEDKHNIRNERHLSFIRHCLEE